MFFRSQQRCKLERFPSDFKPHRSILLRETRKAEKMQKKLAKIMKFKKIYFNEIEKLQNRYFELATKEEQLKNELVRSGWERG